MLTKQQPKELTESDLFETCQKCKEKIDLSKRQVTIFRGKWYHLLCWKEIVGKSN